MIIIEWAIGLPKFKLRVLCLCLLVYAGSASLFAQTSDRTIGQFVHTSWTAKDGAPSDVYALAQTKDGYLWIGSMQGLYRFDCVTFQRYKQETGPALLSSSVTALFALPNGTIQVQHAQDRQVLISVMDTCIGLPADKAEHIFDAFFTTKPEGRGMGLAISRSIIESHGGHVWAIPNSGGGAIFHVTLPAADARLNVSAKHFASQQPPAET
ncbi:MAG TPA: ATP-binding protein [Nitrospira sp.]|nr:ATP-binding protein [Nitrospira sp.]